VFCKNKLVDITPHSHPAIRTLDIVFWLAGFRIIYKHSYREFYDVNNYQ
jgi:hypothetical protein